jgi:hypothetical protein
MANTTQAFQHRLTTFLQGLLADQYVGSIRVNFEQARDALLNQTKISVSCTIIIDELDWLTSFPDLNSISATVPYYKIGKTFSVSGMHSLRVDANTLLETIYEDLCYAIKNVVEPQFKKENLSTSKLAKAFDEQYTKPIIAEATNVDMSTSNMRNEISKSVTATEVKDALTDLIRRVSDLEI